MPTPLESARLAAAINLLRPDWPVPSIRTLIETKHLNRPVHDLAVALVWVATDPETRTPARINEAGPWWAVVAAGGGQMSLLCDRRLCDKCGGLHMESEDCMPRNPGWRPSRRDHIASVATEARRAIRAGGAALASRTRQSSPVPIDQPISPTDAQEPSP